MKNRSQFSSTNTITNVFKQQRLWWLIIPLIISPCFSLAQKRSEAKEIIKFEQFHIDEFEDALKIRFSTVDSVWMDKVVSGKARLQLDIQKGSSAFTDVTIKKEERISKNGMLLTVQPPLTEAIYKTEKRKFTLKLVDDSVTYQTSSTAILGSATKHFDLRPYKKTDTALFIKAVIVVATLTVLMLLITPLYQRFRFKKDHIKKYLVLKEEGKVHQDPFTYVVIDDEDDVVDFDDQVMLLSSWKTLHMLPESQPAIENEIFFKESPVGSYFNPTTDQLIKINRAWFGMIGILVGWIVYLLTMSTGLRLYHRILSNVFDNDELLISTVIARETVLGLTIGVCWSLALALAYWLFDKNKFSIQEIAVGTILRFLLIWLAFSLQALITVYWIQNYYGVNLIAWPLIGIAFAFPTDFSSGLKSRFLKGLISGIIAFGIFEILTLKYFMNIIEVDYALFISLVIMGLSVFLVKTDFDPKQLFASAGFGRLRSLINPEWIADTLTVSNVRNRVRAMLLMATSRRRPDQ